MRYNEDGSPKPEFVLNNPAYKDAEILVAGENFGCGSSREHAPWALLDFGIKCIISTSFADIFYNNCFKNGILPIVVSPSELDMLMEDAERGSNATLSIDLESQTIKGPDGGIVNFNIEADRKQRLLNGIDDIGESMLKAGRHRQIRKPDAPKSTLGIGAEVKLLIPTFAIWFPRTTRIFKHQPIEAAINHE